MKRLLDIILSVTGLLLAAPVLILFMFLIYRQDGSSPFYVATRVGKNSVPFQMIKLRSMVVGADSSGIDSTSEKDSRITPIGDIIRRYKLDELMQLWNVLKGDMSMVGPRPNVQRDVKSYTDIEMELLSVKPGITDISSIVFFDEGKILSGELDPDLAYSQLIRPWKSRLGLIYIDNQSWFLDVKLIWWTVLAIVFRKSVLSDICKMLEAMGVDVNVIKAASRKHKLKPFPPPGMDKVVEMSHEI